MFFIYDDNLKHGKMMLGVMTLIILQSVIFIADVMVGGISFGDLYPTSFVPMLFSLKPFVYSYTLITASFQHVNFLHLLGNLMFFLALARTLEKLLGTKFFVTCYIFIGALAFIGSWLVNPNSTTPIVGSSGAVSFLMGVYLVLFPNAKLRLLIIIPPFFKRFWVPSYVFLLFWIGLQFYDIFVDTREQGGVAYATHILGFLIGVVGGMYWKEAAEDTEQRLNELYEENYEHK